MPIAKLLVVDDEFDSRRDEYLKIEDGRPNDGSGISLQLEFLESPDDLTNRLATQTYDGLILDVRLEPKWGISLDWLLRQVDDKDMPLALISSQWNDTNSDAVNAAWSRPNCRTFLHFSDLDSGEQGALFRTRMALKKMVEEHRQMDTSLVLGNDDPITIAHFSDLHFGGIDPGEIDLETNRIIERIEQQTAGKGVSFIVISGDITEFGFPTEYTLAEEWLTGVAERLKIRLPSSRILLVPGNHDVCRQLAASAAIEKEGTKIRLLDSDIPSQTHLSSYALRPYIDFNKRVSTIRHFLPDASTEATSLAWVESRFAHLGIVFYGVNTAQPVKCFDRPGRKVNEAGLHAIDGALTAIPVYSDDPLVVGITHHSPLEASGNRGVENPDAFARLFGAVRSTALILHGHAHQRETTYTSKPSRLVVSAAPTMYDDNRPKNTLRGFTLLELERKGGRVTALTAMPYTWESGGLSPREVSRYERSDSDGLFRDG